jgi:hypothetical protein
MQIKIFYIVLQYCDKILKTMNLKGEVVCFGSWISAHSCKPDCFGHVVTQNIMMTADVAGSDITS